MTGEGREWPVGHGGPTPVVPWGMQEGRGGGVGLDGVGAGNGIGSGNGRLGGGHGVDLPNVREGATTVNGRLPPEVIRRIVRQNFGRFRLCYENGLLGNPALQGRVAARFVIDASGAVAAASDGGSDLPDATVVACVLRGFGNLSFPQPEAGTVTVVYPIIFAPGSGTSGAADVGPLANVATRRAPLRRRGQSPVRRAAGAVGRAPRERLHGGDGPRRSTAARSTTARRPAWRERTTLLLTMVGHLGSGARAGGPVALAARQPRRRRRVPRHRRCACRRRTI